MKRLLISLFIMSAPASAGTLSCHGGGQWVSFAGIPQLDSNGDQTAIVGCDWLAPLPVKRKAWPPGLPSLSFTRSLATEWSDSKGFIRFWHWEADAPLLRMGAVVTSVSLQAEYRRQLHTLARAVNLNGETLEPQQLLLLDREVANARLKMDLRNINAPFTQAWVGRHYDRRPVTFRVNDIKRIDDLSFDGWEFGLRRHKRHPGLSVNGQLILGSGTIKNNGSSAEVDTLDKTPEYLRTDLELTLQWLLRNGNNHLTLEAGLRSEYVLTPSAQSDDTVKFENLMDTDYVLKASAGVRF